MVVSRRVVDKWLDIVKEDIPDLVPTSSQRMVGTCPNPAHDDRHPSFVVWPEPGYWKCYGCQRGGGILAYMSFVRHLSSDEAEVLLSYGEEDILNPLSPLLNAPTGVDIGHVVPYRRLEWEDVVERVKLERWWSR